MSGIMKKIAAMLLAVAMVTSFTPLYGAGAFAYAEDKEVVAEPDAAGEEDLSPDEEDSGEEAGEEVQVVPDEEVPAADEQGTDVDPVTESSKDTGEEVIDAVEEEEPAEKESQPPANKGVLKAPANRNGEVTMSLTVNKTELEVIEKIPFEIEVSETVDCIRFYRDSTNLGDWNFERWNTDSFSDSDIHRNYCYGQPGTYSAVAIAYSRADNDDLTEIARSNEVEITVTKRGDLGSFSITEANNTTPGADGNIDLTITRGEVMTVDYSAAENASNYWIDVIDAEDDDNWLYFGETSETSYSFSTIELAPGNYYVKAGGNAVGYSDGQSSNQINLTVLDREDSEMYLNVSKTEISTCESVEVSAYYPNAAYIKVFFNSKEDRGWCDDSRGRDVYYGGTQYRNSGIYELLAVAYDDEDNELASKTQIMTVTSEKGPIEFELPELPAYLREGEDALSFTINKPGEAEGIRAEVWFDLDDWDGDNRLYDKETYGDSLTVNIDNNKLQEGMRIAVKVSAWGQGYDETGEEVRIPVIAAASEDVKITAELNEGEDVWVNQGIRFRVEAANEGAKLDRIRFYDGYNFWWEEGADDDGCYDRRISFGEAGTYTVFAKVRLEGAGDDDWIYTEPINIEVKSAGQTGDFNITGLKVNGKTTAIGEDAIKVKRGDTLEFTCSDAENADHYWVDAHEYIGDDNRWEWRGDYAHTNSRSVTFNTIELREGLYRLSVGANGERYENSYAPENIYIEVSDMDIEEGDMYFEVSKTDLVTCEDFTYAIYCPGAEWIELFMNGEDDGWREHGDGEACTRTQNYNSSGEYELVAIAYGRDEDAGKDFEIARSTKTMRVTAPNGNLNLELPEGLPSYIVECTNTIDFTLSKPENASTIKANAWVDSENGGGEVYDDETNGNALNVSINTAGFSAGDRINVRLEAWGYGYEYTATELRIPVIAGSSDEVIITAEENTVPVNQDVEITVAAAGENAQIDRIRFFDGEGFWDEEDADRDGRFTRTVSFDRAGKYAIFAEVMLRGSDEWITCEPLEITATIKGTLNIEKPTSLGTHYDPADGAFTLSIPQPVNASMTRIEIWDKDGNVDYMCMGNLDEFSVKIAQSRLKEGATLRIRIAGWGIGYEYTDKQFSIHLEKHQWGNWIIKKASLTSAGQYKRTCALDASHIETKVIPKNNMKSAAMKKTLTAYAKKNTTFTAAKAFKITNAKGSLSYAKSSGDKKITVAKNGKVTVKKGLKKGKTYSVKVKVTSAATTEYEAATQTVTLKIKIK